MLAEIPLWQSILGNLMMIAGSFWAGWAMSNLWAKR